MWESKGGMDMNYMKYIKRVTADEIRESVVKNDIDWFPIRTCSICGEYIGYRFFHYPYEVMFDSTCQCSSCENLWPREWEDVADHINTQTNEDYATECMRNLKLI